jgi:hypothetical protein
MHKCTNCAVQMSIYALAYEPMEETKTCPVCGKKFHLSEWARLRPENFAQKIYCSHKCARSAMAKRAIARRAENHLAGPHGQCKTCGNDLPARTGPGRPKTFCGDCYATKEKQRQREANKSGRQQRLAMARIETRKRLEKKTCADCGTPIPLEDNINGKRIRCKPCAKQLRTERANKYMKAHPEKRSRPVEAQKLSAERLKALRAQYSSEDLSDAYIKHLIVQGTKISKRAVPKSLIELKRAQLQIARKLKEQKK